jgi:hypothetical protein
MDDGFCISSSVDTPIVLHSTRECGCLNTRCCVASWHLRLGTCYDNVDDRERDRSFKKLKLRDNSG